MSRSLSDVDAARLSPYAQWAVNEIAWRIADDDKTPSAIANELGIPTAAVTDALAQLRAEIDALLGGYALPELSKDEYEALRDDIEAHGQLTPILVDHRGKIVDGKHRMRACNELGIEPVKHTITVGDANDRRAVSLSANFARRHLNSAQKRHVIRVELLLDPTRSDRSLAATTGTDHKTVAAVRRALEDAQAIEHFPSRQDAAGAERPATQPRTTRLEALEELAAHARRYYSLHGHEHPDKAFQDALDRIDEMTPAAVA